MSAIPPLATVGLKKAACREGPLGDITPSPSACALNWKACFSHALDAAREIIGIFIWQGAPPPLDRKIRSNSHHLCPGRLAKFQRFGQGGRSTIKESIGRLRFEVALVAPFEGP